jgi:Protein of unknown function (DUF2865)
MWVQTRLHESVTTRVTALFFSRPKSKLLMVRRMVLLWAGITLAILGSTMPGLANICRGIQVELASLRSARDDNRYANHYAQEAARLSGHMQSIGCDRQSFLIFGQPAPPECQSYRARLAQLRSAVGSSQQSSARRQQLLSLQISHGCRNDSPSPSLTAGLFDDGTRRSSLEVRPTTRIDPNDEEEDSPRIESRIRGVGGKAVCVRLCDGYHFPLELRNGSLRETGEETCQALCPAAETKVFVKPGEIENARSLEGENYTALPNALRYRKSFDPSCYCRRQGETLASQTPRVLNPDGARSTPFGVLNQDPVASQDDLPLRGATTDSIGREAKPSTKKDKKSSVFGAAKIPEPPSPPQEPPEFPAERTVLSTQGEIRQFPLPDGTMRTVRVIGTPRVDAPSEAAKASTLGHDPGQ